MHFGTTARVIRVNSDDPDAQLAAIKNATTCVTVHQPFSTAFCSSLAKLYNSSGRLLLSMLKLSNGFLTVQEVPEDKKNKVQQIFF